MAERGWKTTQELQKEWQDHLRRNADVFRANEAPPAQLHFLSSVFFGHSMPSLDGKPTAPLMELLEDEHLVELVLAAFAGVVCRRDLPSVQEALALAADSKMPHLAWPLLAGLEQLAPKIKSKEVSLKETTLRRALALHALYGPRSGGLEPKWHRWVVVERPDLVAENLLLTYKATLRGGATRYYALYELECEAAYAGVAARAVEPLLRAFPVRTRTNQLGMLVLVLIAALKHCEADRFCAIIDSKVASRSIGAKQKIYWLCAGLLLRPAAYVPWLDRELTGRSMERRERYVAEFFGSDGIVGRLSHLDLSATDLLIRHLGKAFRPTPVGQGPQVYATVPGATLVAGLIDAVSNTACPQATEMLEQLAQEPSLTPWQESFRRAALRQQDVRRDAEFRYPTVGEVIGALDKAEPVNAADLTVFAYDELASLARRIRDGATSDRQQYWSELQDGSWKPKPENSCRDQLLSDLLLKLQRFDVTADKEPSYADDNRADIRLSRSNFNVPVEIKKSDSPDLWTAIREQLIPRYARDPGAAGCGIYLVFWFGRAFCKRSPKGRKPSDAASLPAELCASAKLTPEEKRRIKVLVIDVSRRGPNEVAKS